MKKKSSILKCPVCEKELFKIEQHRLFRCEKNHTFDLAKEGYINLLLIQDMKSKNPGDSKEMVDSRQKFLAKGFYRKISSKINETIADLLKAQTDQSLNLLDMGCGEGYYFDRLIKHLKLKSANYYGLDISKSAIKTASKQNDKALWMVGNSFFTPFKDHSLDCILSVFSPIDMKECKRLLKEDGVLVRVFPETNHLMQLKEVIYPEIKVKEYEQYLSDFTALEVCSVSEVSYDIELSNEDLGRLLLMTPHFWRVKEENKAKLLEMESIVVTISVTVGVYRPKKTKEKVKPTAKPIAKPKPNGGKK